MRSELEAEANRQPYAPITQEGDEHWRARVMHAAQHARRHRLCAVKNLEQSRDAQESAGAFDDFGAGGRFDIDEA